MGIFSNFIAVVGQVSTLFLLMAVGFVLAKLGKINDMGRSQMSSILLYIVSPCLVITAFQVERTPELLREVGAGAAVSIGCYVVYILVSQFCFPRQEQDVRDSLRYAMVYGNIGFMGVPLVQAILGADAMIYGVLFLGAFNLATWTHGVLLMGGKKSLSLRRILINPGILGLVLGIGLFLLNLRLPAPVASAVTSLSGLNTPLAMVVIGSQLATVHLPSVFGQARLYLLSLCRLVLLPALTAVALLPLQLSPGLYCASVLLSATPVAGNTSIFAQRFGRDTSTAVQAITLSTLLSIITLPLFAVLAKSISGF